MAQLGYFSVACCGRMYKTDGSEEALYEQDHPDGECLQEDHEDE